MSAIEHLANIERGAIGVTSPGLARRFLSGAIGEVVWNPRIPYGRVLALELGRPSLVIERESEPPSRRTSAKFPPPRLARAHAFVHGRWTCWMNSEVWSVHWNRRQLVTQAGGEERIRIVLAHLQGQRLVAIRVDHSGALLRFNGRMEIKVGASGRSAVSPLGGDLVVRAAATAREVGFDLHAQSAAYRSGRREYRFDYRSFSVLRKT